MCVLSGTLLWASDERRPRYPSYPYEVALTHEIGPHRRTIPVQGIRSGFNQLRLTLIVSPEGVVVDASATGDESALKFWQQLRGEVVQWKFKPFEKHGRAVTAEVEEYIDLVPPERLPEIHIPPPLLRRDSNVTITLDRSGCYGTCPAYTLTVSTDGIVFDGKEFVAAHGRRVDKVDAAEVRKLAQKFVTADFYSMDERYVASVTDHPTVVLTITIDGHTKKLVDYVGQWVGMPAVVKELEHEVDSLARSSRWIGHTNRR
jgi:hypothetical protein